MAELLRQPLFPRALYGTTRGTRAEWNKVSRRAAKLGNWDEALADTEFVDVAALPGEIVIGRSGKGRKSDEEHWRVYWCIDFESLYRLPGNEEISEDQHARLILGGMRYFWFALAMLENSGGDLPVLHNMKDRVLAAKFFGQVAESFVEWLEPMLGISARLADESFERDFMALNFGRFWWLNGLVKLLCHAADRTWTFGQRWWEEIERDFNGDCVEWMIAKQFIERTEGGFRIPRLGN